MGQFTAISGILGPDWVYSGLYGDILSFLDILGVISLDSAYIRPVRGRSLIITRGGIANKWLGIGPDSMTPLSEGVRIL